MHDSRKVFLLDDEPRCVLCTYEADTPTQKASSTEFKTWDSNIKVGDYVVVPTDTRHCMTVVKVVDVDVEPNIESHAKMDWIIGTVDRHDFEAIVAQERRFLDAARSAEKARKKKELKEAFLADVDGSKFALSHHPAAQNSAEPAAE